MLLFQPESFSVLKCNSRLFFHNLLFYLQHMFEKNALLITKRIRILRRNFGRHRGFFLDIERKKIRMTMHVNGDKACSYHERAETDTSAELDNGPYKSD